MMQTHLKKAYFKSAKIYKSFYGAARIVSIGL